MNKALVLTFVDPREDVRLKRKSIVEEELGKIAESFGHGYELEFKKAIGDIKEALTVMASINDRDFVAVILHVPVFVDASIACLVARSLNCPILLLSNRRADSHSTVGYLAVKGAMLQLGIKFKGLLGNIDEPGIVDKLSDFIKAAGIVKSLEGNIMGLFGGPALGILTACADPAEWLEKFGVLIKNIDQSEIVSRAKKVKAEEVERMKSWLLGKIEGALKEQGLLDDASLDRQLRSYLALKSLSEEMRLDFISLQCQPGMSDGYALQCANCAFSNDPYDCDGPKEPRVFSCEADMDGALTMQVMKFASGLKPTALLDLRSVPDNGPLTLTNCGGLATWFAGHSDAPEENLGNISLVPHIFGRAGGAALKFIAKPGEATLARLYRQEGKYRMLIVRGRVTIAPSGGVHTSLSVFPHVFFDGDFDRKALVENLGSNHIHMASGNISQVLSDYCDIAGIKSILLG